MRYDFSKMDSDSFENMVRSLNEGIFGVKCEQYGLGPDGQREFVFEGILKDGGENVLHGRTMGQVKYKYHITKTDDYKWLIGEIDKELNHFRKKEAEYIPDNYLFYTNIVLTPAKDTGIKDKVNAYIKTHNDIIKHFYVIGYDEICAMLDNNRDVATSDKVCIDINVLDRKQRKEFKFAEHVFALGNEVLGYEKEENDGELDPNENYILIGGPGNGKSTICQFIAQVYRANYLQMTGYYSQILNNFVEEIRNSYKYQINISRIPFKIVLREYAAWINRKKEENISVLQYMKDRIKRISGDTVSTKALRKMLREQAWIFFFDGLDEVPESSNRQEVLRQIHIILSIELKELYVTVW